MAHSKWVFEENLGNRLFTRCGQCPGLVTARLLLQPFWAEEEGTHNSWDPETETGQEAPGGGCVFILVPHQHTVTMSGG